MLGARIAALRRDAGWSQAELALRLKVSASAIGMYEQGRREPSMDTLVALAEIFSVTTDYLLTGKPLIQEDLEATGRILRQALESAQNTLSTRPNAPFSQSELATFLAAMLLEA